MTSLPPPPTSLSLPSSTQLCSPDLLPPWTLASLTMRMWDMGRKRAIRHFGKIASIRFPDFNIDNRMLTCSNQN